MLLTISYSESAYPIIPVEPLKASLYDYFVIWFILFTSISILYIKLNDSVCFFVSLFVCSELIEELARATDLKFGMQVEHVVSRNKTKDLNDISTKL